MGTSSIVAALAVVPLLPLIGLFLLKLSLRSFGRALQIRGEDRRAAVVSRVHKDRDAVRESQSAQYVNEDGWETVEKAGSAENGKAMQDDWDGVVGFFHPFW